MGRGNTLPTIWEIPDDLWEQIHPVILQMEPPKFTGRKRVHPRQILDGIIFRMRTGSHWTRLPRDLGALDWEWQSADCAMGKARFGGFSWCQPHG
jgi:transposase